MGTLPHPAARKLADELFDHLWVGFTIERKEARRQCSDESARQQIEMGSEWVKRLIHFMRRIHVMRTTPRELLKYPPNLQLSGIYKSLFAAFQLSKKCLTDDLLDLFSVHARPVHFAGVTARCYALLVRELALKHKIILAQYSNSPHIAPTLNEDEETKAGWLYLSDQTVERFTEQQFAAINDEFDKIPAFDFGSRIRMTVQLLTELDRVLWADVSVDAETKGFKDTRHVDLLKKVQSIVDERLANEKRVTILQSLADAGCDVLVEFTAAAIKCGVQVKSWGDINGSAFARDTLAQIEDSRRHGLRRLHLILCGDLTDRSQEEKVRQLTSRLSQRNDDYVRVVPPERAWNLLGQVE